MSVIELGCIAEMVWDCLSGPEGHTKNPSWLEIEARIRALNTPEYSCVFLSAKNGTFLTIGGDEQHGCLVFFQMMRNFHMFWHQMVFD